MPFWTRVVGLFLVAGLAEIGGGWLIWQWMRNGRPVSWAICGSIALVAYGFIATWQPTDFGRVYAAYGGVFIALSVAWGWLVDKQAPDFYDVVGTSLAVVGACVMMFAPRS